MSKHIQRPIKGERRIRAAGMLESAIRARLQYLAEKHNTSESFVEATILADALGIKVREHYYDYRPTTKKSKRTA